MTAETFLAATADDGWMTIDQLVAMLDAAGYWSDGMLAGSDVETEKRQHVEQMVDQLSRLRDANDWFLISYVWGVDPIRKRPTRICKQERFFTADDYRMIIGYYSRREAE